MDSLLQIKNCSFKYKRSQNFVFDRINLTIYKNDFIAISGRNGAGKSTLAKVLAGILSYSSGQIIKKNNTKVSYVSLRRPFLGNLSVSDSIVFDLLLQGITNLKMINECKEKVLNFCELIDGEQFVKDLSDGYKARLSFALAMFSSSEVIILDEVLSVGDIFFRDKCISQINSLLNSNRAVIYIGHDETFKQNFSNRNLTIEAGKLVEVY